MGYTTDTELIYYVLNLFSEMKIYFGTTLPLGLSKIAQMYSSVGRLGNLLEIEEMHKSYNEFTGKPSVVLKDVSFRLGDKQILNEVSLNVTKCGLTVVTGIVGSGKSSLLNILLQEYHPDPEGKIYFSTFKRRLFGFLRSNIFPWLELSLTIFEIYNPSYPLPTHITTYKNNRNK